MINLGLPSSVAVWPASEPGVQIVLAAPPLADGPPGVHRSPLVAETPSSPEEVVTRGPYSAIRYWSGRVSIITSSGWSGLGRISTRPISIRFIRIVWLVSG